MPLGEKSSRLQRHRFVETNRVTCCAIQRARQWYPITLLQLHPDARITATRETARHPISENPDWELL